MSKLNQIKQIRMLIFSPDRNLVIDPIYKTINDFAVDYDYDLLGQSIKTHKSFLNNPLFYIRWFLENYSIGISITCILLPLTSFISIFLINLTSSTIHLLKTIFYGHVALSKFFKTRSERKRLFLPYDHDRYAQILSNIVTYYHKLHEWNAPISKTYQENEAVRFVFDYDPWLRIRQHRYLDRATRNEPWSNYVEGLEADNRSKEIIQNYFKNADSKLLCCRSPSPNFDLLDSSSSSEDQDEVKERNERNAWIKAYEDRLKKAAKETYKWWLSQETLLPEETSEIKSHRGEYVARLTSTDEDEEGDKHFLPPLSPLLSKPYTEHLLPKLDDLPLTTSKVMKKGTNQKKIPLESEDETMLLRELLTFERKRIQGHERRKVSSLESRRRKSWSRVDSRLSHPGSGISRVHSKTKRPKRITKHKK